MSQGFIGYHLQQALHLGCHRAHRIRPGVVAHPAVHDGPGVDGDEVALAQDELPRGNAVHHGIVHRGADGAGKAAVALEGRNAALGADDLLGDGVQLGRGDAGLDRLAHAPQRQRRHAARLLHGLDLSRGLQLHCHGITLSAC